MDNPVEAAETQAVDTAPTTPTVDTETQTSTAEQAQAEPQETDTTEPETFDRAYVEKLRAESASYRTKAKEQAAKAEADKNDLVQRLGKALGFITDEQAEQADAEKLVAEATAQRDQMQKQLNEYRINDAVTKAAAAHNADVSILAPFLRGTGALDALDPTADEYVSQVEQLVAETVQANPKLAVSTIPVVSGVDTTASKGEPAPITLADLNNMTDQEVYQARREGKLNHLFN